MARRGLWYAAPVGFSKDPRFVKVGARTWPLFFAGEDYCWQYLTDGFIPYDVVPTLVPQWSRKCFYDAAARFVDAAIWELLAQGERGFKSLEYLKHNVLAVVRRQKLEAQSEAMRRKRGGERRPAAKLLSRREQEAGGGDQAAAGGLT